MPLQADKRSSWVKSRHKPISEIEPVSNFVIGRALAIPLACSANKIRKMSVVVDRFNDPIIDVMKTYSPSSIVVAR